MNLRHEEHIEDTAQSGQNRSPIKDEAPIPEIENAQVVLLIVGEAFIENMEQTSTDKATDHDDETKVQSHFAGQFSLIRTASEPHQRQADSQTQNEIVSRYG